MSMPATNYFTADAVRALPDDGNRYETVHGELVVTQAPRGIHQLVLARLFHVLNTYLLAHGLEEVLWAPADISFSSDTLVQPDVFVGDLGAFRVSGRWGDLRVLHLVIEVVSPSSARADRFTKRRLYQEQRIPAYWVVDIDQRQVEVWTPEAQLPTVQRQLLTWRHPALGDDCVVDVAKLFST